MKEDNKEEIEMQTYSMSYAVPTTLPTALPYNWDGECHLTLNNAFYASIDPPIEDNTDQFLNFEEDENFGKEEEPLVIKISPMNCNEYPRTESIESVESIGSLSTDGTGSQKSMPAEFESLDQQIDFILDSVKKPTRPAVPKPKVEKKKKMSRKRKTTAQIEALQKELGEAEVIDKNKMKELAEATGLTVGQVYKWYWDFHRKQGNPSSVMLA
jgi:hypothetical protein